MQAIYDTNETGVQRASLGCSVVALARYTIARMGLPLAGQPFPPRNAGMPSDAASRADTPLFPDTEASWQPLSQAPDGAMLCGVGPMCTFSGSAVALIRVPRTHAVTLEQQRAACRGNAQAHPPWRPTMRLADFIGGACAGP